MFMSFWLVMPVYAQTAISLDLEPLATNAVPAEENLADWQKGLEILQGITLKERGAEFDYKCRGRWDTDQICKYIWAASNAWGKGRYGRSLKFAAAGLALNPRVRQLLARVGNLLVAHCVEALPFMERGVGLDDRFLGDLTHCRDNLASSPNDVRRARRLLWVSAHLNPPSDWERQRIADALYDKLEFEAADSLDASDSTWQAAHLRDRAWARRRTLETFTHTARFFVGYLRQDHVTSMNTNGWFYQLSTFPGLPQAEVEATVKVGEDATSHGGVTWGVPIATVRNFFEIQKKPDVKPIDDLWTFGSLGLRMALVHSKEKPSAFDKATPDQRFAWLLATGQIWEARQLQSKVYGAVEAMGFLNLNCLHILSFDRTTLASELDLPREVTWKALWSKLCGKNVSYTAHWIEQVDLKAASQLMAAVVDDDEVMMRVLATALKDSEFMQAQVARLWAGAVLGDAMIFDSAKKATINQAALKWFDLLAETVFLAKTQDVAKAKAHFDALPPYVRSGRPESAEAAGYVFIAVRACGTVDMAFATELHDIYFKNSALGGKLITMIKKQGAK